MPVYVVVHPGFWYLLPRKQGSWAYLRSQGFTLTYTWLCFSLKLGGS